MTVLVDSDVLIEVSRGRDEGTASRWVELGNAAAVVLYSPVTVAELWAGVHATEHEALEKLFSGLTCAPIGEETGRRAGAYMRQYGRSHALEVADALIAAASVEKGARLWTRNRKHFPMNDVVFFQ